MGAPMSSAGSVNAGEAFSKATRGTKIAGGGAIVLLIAVFLPWVSISVEGLGGSSGSGWSAYGLAKLAALCALVILAVIGIELFAPQVTLPFPGTLVVLGAAALAVLCVVYHLLFLGSDAGDIEGLGIDVGRAWGMFVALIAAGVTAYGAFTRLSE